MTGTSKKLLRAIGDMAADLPSELTLGIASQLRRVEGVPRRSEFESLAATGALRNRIGKFVDLILSETGVDCRAVALALETSVDIWAEVRNSQSVEIAWTGPATSAVPVRRVDQVMYELIEAAKEEVVVTSFVTWGADRALAALRDATERGVTVSLYFEVASASGGAIEFDGVEQVKIVVPEARIFFWPLENRRVGDDGKRGILHAKCLVCDRKIALVSSANLTDKALELNLELGLLVRGGEVPQRLAMHFERLVTERILHPLV